MNIRKLFFIILLLLIPISAQAFAQNTGSAETFVGTLNIGHSHFADGTDENTFYLFDYQNFVRPTVLLELEGDDFVSLSALSANAGDLMGITGTVLSEKNFGNTIVLDVSKIHTQRGDLKYGATVELDQRVYTWTDKIYVTVVAPDFNKNAQVVETIGNGQQGKIVISTSNHTLENYVLYETGADTGIFTGEVILTGFSHDVTNDNSIDTNPKTFGRGNSDGLIQTLNEDSIIVSFEASGMLVAATASVSWHLGEITLHSLPTASPQPFGVRVVDPDMNLDPEKMDSFTVNVNSDSNLKGIDITVTETNDATGIFEGAFFMTTKDVFDDDYLKIESYDGEKIHATYVDYTLPYPHSIKDNQSITATTTFGVIPTDFENAAQSDIFFMSHHRTIPDEPEVPDSISSVTILAKFNNVAEIPHPSIYFEDIFYGDADSLAMYWKENSFDKFTMDGVVIDWTELPRSSNFYVKPNGQLDAETLLNHAIQQVDPLIDFNGPDDVTQNRNSQNFWQSGQTGDDVDQIILVTNTEHITNFNLFPKLQAFAFLHPHSVMTDEGPIHMWQSFYVDGGESFPIGSNIQKGYGAVAHELGHNFGWYHTPMLKPLDTYSDPWSVMSGWNDNSAPSGPIAYHKNKANWLNSDDLVEVLPGQSKIVELQYLNLESPDSDSYHMVKIPFGNGEFYTVEARQDVLFDNIPEPSGLIVYHYNPDGYGDDIFRQTVSLDVLAPVSVNYEEDWICDQRHANGQCIRWDFTLLDIDLGQTQIDQTNNISVKLLEEKPNSLVAFISNNAPDIITNISISDEISNVGNTISVSNQSSGNIHIEFTDSFGNIIPGITYDIMVSHDNQIIFNETNLFASTGIVSHTIPSLANIASDANPVDIVVSPNGSDFTVQVVPEFGIVVSMVFVISIISIMIVARSNLFCKLQ